MIVGRACRESKGSHLALLAADVDGNSVVLRLDDRGRCAGRANNLDCDSRPLRLLQPTSEPGVELQPFEVCPDQGRDGSTVLICLGVEDAAIERLLVLCNALEERVSSQYCPCQGSVRDHLFFG